MHEGGGRWVGSNKLVELKKKEVLPEYGGTKVVPDNKDYFLEW